MLYKLKEKHMAIFGAGSTWGNDELKQRFFDEEKFILGWNEDSAKDLYEVVSHLKVGDIVYLKANSPGSRSIRVKGVGIVTKSVIQCKRDNEYGNQKISDWNAFFVKIKWVCKEEFHIDIPDNEGRLTNVRAATFYEEYLPFVQNKILEKITDV